jgi:2Fe-2S ferredoxin
VGFFCCYGFNGTRIAFDYICQAKNYGDFTLSAFHHCLSYIYPDSNLYVGLDVMIELIAKLRSQTVEAQDHLTILDLAIKHGIPWAFSCTHGTCARCRCLVSVGLSLLNEPTEAELDRLEPEEIAQGYRLACQTKVIGEGHVKVKNVPYF